MPNLVSITRPSLQILGKSQTGVFLISGFLDKKNKTMSKKNDDDVMPEDCDLIVIFRIFSQFRAAWRSDSGNRVCKSQVSVIVTFFVTKTENRTKESLTQLSQYCFE